MIQEDDVLPGATDRHFCQQFIRRTTQQTLLAIRDWSKSIGGGGGPEQRGGGS